MTMTEHAPATEPELAPSAAGSPGWLREFATTLSVHSQFVFHGNVHDQFVTADGGRLTSLPALLWEVLRENGFTCLFTYDQIDGLGVRPAAGPGADKAKLAAGRLLNGLGRTPDLTELQQDISAVVGAGERCAFVLAHASRLSLRNSDLGAKERDFFLFCAKLGVNALRRGGAAPYNPVIWLVDNEGDLPNWLTVGNAHVRSIAVPPPDLGDRQRAAALLIEDYEGAESVAAEAKQKVVDAFAVESHGMTLDAMAGVAQLAQESRVPFDRLAESVATYRLGVIENPWRQSHLRARLQQRAGDLGARVKGQPQAVAKALDVLKRAAMGLSGAHTGKPGTRPRGVLFFAGPTGVGKTELAKGIAQLVYGDESALLRLDMSEFSESHAADRLIGSPPGYVGHDAGGQLTNAMRRQPFRVVLFDEIEKAHPLVLDKFLQILEDGRLTDGRGDTAYFSESILIFTSNLGVQKKDPKTGVLRNLIEPGLAFDKVDVAVREAISDHFRYEIKRPELLNRIGDNIVVFDFIGQAAAEMIFFGQVANVRNLVAAEHGVSVELAEWVTGALKKDCTTDLTFGGRGIGNQVEARLVNPLARALFDEPLPRGTRVTVSGFDQRSTPPALELVVDE
ncbi:AAA family ATPase [Amycolatopsis sp. NPDC005961]|uniref:AAA family ATPase n=1 Tax=Amycolatopsis sp. NPDC005961 TaxID=3156720 RepID=UPI0033F68854